MQRARHRWTFFPDGGLKADIAALFVGPVAVPFAPSRTLVGMLPDGSDETSPTHGQAGPAREEFLKDLSAGAGACLTNLSAQARAVRARAGKDALRKIEASPVPYPG